MALLNRACRDDAEAASSPPTTDAVLAPGALDAPRAWGFLAS
jgi:hypothetical protein